MEFIKHPNGYYYHPSAEIGLGVKIGNEVTIGKNVKIGELAKVENETKIGDGVIVGKGVIIRNGTIVKEQAIIEDWVTIGKDTVIGANTRISKGIYVGDCTVIGKEAIINRSPITIFRKYCLNEYCQGKVYFGCEALTFVEWYKQWRELCKKYYEFPEWFRRDVLPIIEFIEYYQEINPLDKEA